MPSGERRVGVGGGGDQLVGQPELLAHAAHGREQRLAAVEAPGGATADLLDLERERRLHRQHLERAREAREQRLVERALLDHELGVGGDGIDRRAALDAARRSCWRRPAAGG